MNTQRPDPSQNFLETRTEPLDLFFRPRSIAVVGAKDEEGSVGGTLMRNLKEGFPGRIFPVNPKREQVLGLQAFPSVSAIPEPVDLAVIVTPAATVPAIAAECVSKGIRAAIVISAGFKELGPEGAALEQELLTIARSGGLRIIGPNCLGLMNPMIGLNATFASKMALPGRTAFLSQSGAMCTSVLDWSLTERIGFSAFVSIGSMADIGWGDLIDYLGHDPNTDSILLYMETIGDPRSFLSACREVALSKPIIVIKGGRTEAASTVAASHTGAMTGSDEVFEAACERAGILRVHSIGDLFSCASVLARQPRPKGSRLAILTNAGGPSVLATDAAVLQGASMASLSKDALEALNSFLPPYWSHANPVDVLGDAGPTTYGKAASIVAADPSNDGVLVILTPQDMTDPTESAKQVISAVQNAGKPILASWMGGASVQPGVQLLNAAGIPTFDYPDEGAKIFAQMVRYSRNLAALYETPAVRDDLAGQTASHAKAQALINSVLSEGRQLLDEFESKQLLAAYGLPVVRTVVAHTADAATEAAEAIGYPVVVKLYSKMITHKSDIGGVKLNLRDGTAVRHAFDEIQRNTLKAAGAAAFEGVTVQPMVKLEGYEVILGSSLDPQFGPVLLFGTGGQLTEVYKDRALGFPPLNATLAHAMMEKTKIYTALQGVRGRRAVDMAALEQILVRFSQLIAENPEIAECDINPLLVSPDQMIALDARVVLARPSEQKPARLAIRPYPIQYIHTAQLRSGQPVIIRPVRPEDEPLLVDFHRSLSENSVRQPYLEVLSLDERIAHDRLIRLCCPDYDRDITLVAEIPPEKGRSAKVVGVARLSRTGPGVGDFKLVISDPFQNQGLGRQMLSDLLAIARTEGLSTVTARILQENGAMLHLVDQMGFTRRQDGNLVHVTLQNVPAS
jgi:acetyltransferase